MSEHPAPPVDEGASLGYEPRDVRVGWIVAFAMALAAMVILVLPLTDWIFDRLESSAAQRDAPTSPLAAKQEPPEPRLESRPAAELAALRRREDEKLTKYRWLNREQGIVQIPVERAIELLVERGLPEPKAGENPRGSDASSPEQKGEKAESERER